MAESEPTETATVGIGFLAFILSVTDAFLQGELLMFTDAVDPGARKFRVGCGMSLTLAYLLSCLPFATSLSECLWFLVWVNLIFNAGCILEMRFGLFRRAVDVLVDSDGADWKVPSEVLSEVLSEVPSEVQVAVMSGIVGGITTFLCTWCFL